MLWVSKLQTEIALLTMESEYIALRTSRKDLRPRVDPVKKNGTTFRLPIGDVSNIYVRVHEDNVGAFTLGIFEPRCMTPCSKHYIIMYDWFREQIQTRKIQLIKIASADRLGDIFIKGLSKKLIF